MLQRGQLRLTVGSKDSLVDCTGLDAVLRCKVGTSVYVVVTFDTCQVDSVG